MIIQRCENCDFIKANLVSFAPLDNNNKLRYPNNKELLEGANNWSKKILKYDLIVLFGNKVQETILKDKRFKNINYICATHPSYIWVYKHNEINDYINEIIKKIKTTLKE